AISTVDLTDIPRRITAEQARQFLLGAVMVEVAVILLIVTNAAASTVTREKEDGTLDLLLSTPITSRYYIWGKLRGLVSFVLPLVAVPVFSVLVFVIVDVFRMIGAGSNFEWVIFPETVLINPQKFAEDAYGNPDNWIRNRMVLFVFGWTAVAAYAGIVWTMYKSMVKNFDMTIRKQSR